MDGSCVYLFGNIDILGYRGPTWGNEDCILLGLARERLIILPKVWKYRHIADRLMLVGYIGPERSPFPLGRGQQTGMPPPGGEGGGRLARQHRGEGIARNENKPSKPSPGGPWKVLGG